MPNDAGDSTSGEPVESGPLSVEGEAAAAVARSKVVNRVLDDLSLAVLGIVVGIALAVFFGVLGVWESLVAAALCTFGALALIVVVFRNGLVRDKVVGLARWLLDP
jgi:hypothetical protein